MDVHFLKPSLFFLKKGEEKGYEREKVFESFNYQFNFEPWYNT
jgi:hypothetical protein